MTVITIVEKVLSINRQLEEGWRRRHEDNGANPLDALERRVKLVKELDRRCTMHYDQKFRIYDSGYTAGPMMGRSLQGMARFHHKQSTRQSRRNDVLCRRN